jgi:hypothetical protein
MDQSANEALRQHVIYLLTGGGAHMDFDSFVSDLDITLANRKITRLPYTIWHVLEHMRIAQWDILEFSRDVKHVSPPFPEGYWPPPNSETDASQFKSTVSRFRADLKAMQELVANRNVDLLKPIPHGDGQTMLREALLVADHNAYHLGALAVMKRIVEEGKE